MKIIITSYSDDEDGGSSDDEVWDSSDDEVRDSSDDKDGGYSDDEDGGSSDDWAPVNDGDVTTESSEEESVEDECAQDARAQMGFHQGREGHVTLQVKLDILCVRTVSFSSALASGAAESTCSRDG